MIVYACENCARLTLRLWTVELDAPPHHKPYKLCWPCIESAAERADMAPVRSMDGKVTFLSKQPGGVQVETP